MSPATVRIEWLVPNWSGVTEVVSVNRVKTREPLVVGMKVRVSYKSGIFNAQIIDIEQGKCNIIFNLVNLACRPKYCR